MNSKIFTYLSAFLLLSSFPLAAAIAVDQAPDVRIARVVYQKPAAMSAMAWLQHLEDERDQADIRGDFKAFKRITNEISATLAGKHGLSDEVATEEEQVEIAHSIARTRHRFRGQRHMLHDRYLSYDRAQTSALLETDPRFRGHMAAVLAIDTMVAKSFEDDDFADSWGAWNDTEEAPPTFIPAVMEHARSNEASAVFDPLHQPLQDFLRTGQNTIRLANEVARVFAPSITFS